MDWKDVPVFYQLLCKTQNITQLALRLLILTGVHTNPLRHIREDQIEDDIWTIPAENIQSLAVCLKQRLRLLRVL